MSDKNTIMLGTRKGLITYERGATGWELKDTSFLGIPISLTHVDTRIGTWWACLDHGHWGQKLHRSQDQGKTWEEVEAPKYPEGTEVKEGVTAAVRYLWAFAEGGPDQEQTLVGEKGILLSGGQKQRLSLARGMYTPCKLMVLDNVLSAVDNKTERYLLDQIFNQLRSEATLIISHRATVLEKVDRIIVLDNGSIVAEGSHHELLEQSDFYRETYQLQQAGGDQ